MRAYFVTVRSMITKTWKAVTKQGKKEPVAIVAASIALVAALFTAVNAISNVGNYIRLMNSERYSQTRSEVLQLLADLQQAELNACAAKSSPSGSHTFKLALEQAATIEAKNRNEVPVHAYHALTDLGNEYWDFARLQMYCELAIEKSVSEFDKQLSYQQLGCAHFDAYEASRVSAATLQNARLNFEIATTLLRKTSQEKRAARLLGQAYELWAAHEAYHKNLPASEEAARQAKLAWATLPKQEQMDLAEALQSHLEQASNGLHPKSPCRTSSKVNSYSTGTYTVNVPQLSRDKSLGEIINGKLHMHYVELLPSEMSLASYDDAGKQITSKHLSFSHDIQARIFDDPDADIPLLRYVRFDRSYPTDAPALPHEKALLESTRALEDAKLARSILEETQKQADDIRTKLPTIATEITKIVSEQLTQLVDESAKFQHRFDDILAKIEKATEKNEQERIRLEKLAEHLYSLLPIPQPASPKLTDTPSGNMSKP